MTSLAPALPVSHAAESVPGPGSDLRQFGVAFLTSLNHAIRTPLSGILGLTQLLMEGEINEENREYLASIGSCAATLNDLLSSTLDYASHAAGAIHLEEQDFLLSTAIEAGLRDARQRAAKAGTAFDPVLDGDMRQVVRSDALRLRDVVALSARVAIHSAGEGRAHLRMTLNPWGARRGELVLEIWRKAESGAVAGNLPPLGARESEELLSHSFSIETLEIALLHRLVALLHGSVRIQPEPDHEVALRVTLPVALRDAVLREERESAPAARPAVLIVDDNRISLRILSSVLNRSGFESVAVESGTAAIEALVHRGFDAVLLDLLMPGMDGGITTARVRALPNCTHIPILGITAGVTDELRENCRRNGMNAILEKPIDAAELVAQLRFHLGRPASTTGPGDLV